MSMSMRGWIIVIILAIVIGLIVGVVFHNAWIALLAFICGLIGFPIIIILIAFMGWIASGSH